MSDTLKPLEDSSLEAVSESGIYIVTDNLEVNELAFTVNEHGLLVDESLAWSGLLAAIVTKSREGGTYLFETTDDEHIHVSRIINTKTRHLGHSAKIPPLSRHKAVAPQDLIIGQELILHGTSHNNDRLREGSMFVISPIISAIWLPLQTPSQ